MALDRAPGEVPGEMIARHLTLEGRVQGVGFRPFVYRLAGDLGLAGNVRNQIGRVEIIVQGPGERVERFIAAVIDAAPPLSRPRLTRCDTLTPRDLRGFSILASDAAGPSSIHVPPDYFTCDDCLRELGDPHDRRYRYPFINCTQCGPRYTLIESLPYDRPNTSMAAFTLCPACARDYADPGDRRFHAEPVACPECGPQLEYVDASATARGNEAALTAALETLRGGGILGVKGIGGYHLCCDARNGEAVARLRTRKQRPHKPLAVMFPAWGADDLDMLRADVILDPARAALLRSPARPIVLCPPRPDRFPPAVAPGLDEVGVFLPYSPLHHLLLAGYGGPLVATSGNISGEPVITDNAEAQRRLAPIVDAFVHHDRPIVRPADDPVYRVIAGKPRPLRLGRGTAPTELALPGRLHRPVLATGGHMKNTLAIAWDDRVVLSPHVGDLEALRSQQVFEQLARDLPALYGIAPRALICDAHPGYASSRWARAGKLPVTPVWHHRAHASALAGEHPDVARWLVFAWDGVGLGEDGTLWGGEALLGRPGHWRRVASWRAFRIPGGDRAGREPWRSAAALCWETGLDWDGVPGDAALARHAWVRGVNTRATSAVGRLFDAAAALTGLIHTASFEGQGPMLLEALAANPQAPIPLPLVHDDGLWRTDWAPLLPLLRDHTIDPAIRAGRFHASVAAAAVEQAQRVRDEHGEITIGLGGGVFQNDLLSRTLCSALAAEGFDVRLAGAVPCNDGGLAFGQVIEYAALQDNAAARGPE